MPQRYGRLGDRNEAIGQDAGNDEKLGHEAGAAPNEYVAANRDANGNHQN